MKLNLRNIFYLIHFKKAEINSEFLSSVWTAVWDTNSDKKKKEDEKKQISN